MTDIVPFKWRSPCFLLVLVIGAPIPAVAAPPESERSTDIQFAEAQSRSFRHAIKTARPSIVTVRTVERQPASEQAPEAYRPGNGTGVIVDRTGGILTNFHAVVDAEVVSVVLADGREFPATEIRGDAWSDLALIRIDDAGELPEARLGESENAELGDWVIAAGDSFGLGFSANPGTISAMQRELAGKNLLLLQTNAPTNPGNSGGPLLNLRGEVIGICEGGYSVQGGFDGVSFAIPIDVAKFVVQELATNKTVRWPYLGIHFETLSPSVAHELGYRAGQTGAIVTRVDANAPAARAGLQVGDIVTFFASDSIADAAGLVALIQRTRVGESVEVTLLRDHATMTCPVMVETFPETPEFAHSDSHGKVGNELTESDEQEAFGMSVTDLPDKFKLPPDVQGVFIKQVESGSAARYMGVHPNSVITHIGAQPVRDLDAFKAILKNRGDSQGVALLIWCGDCGEHFFAIRQEYAKRPKWVFPRRDHGK